MKGGAKVFAPRAAKVANSNEVENFKDWGIAQVYLRKTNHRVPQENLK